MLQGVQKQILPIWIHYRRKNNFPRKYTQVYVHTLRRILWLYNHNQERLEHFKDKHVFSCGLIKLKVDASDAELAPELLGNQRAVKVGNEKESEERKEQTEEGEQGLIEGEMS